MKKRLSNFVFVFLFLSTLAFWALYPVAGTEVATEIASSLALGAALTLSLTWFPAATKAFVRLAGGHRLDGYEIFHLGFWGLMLDLLFLRVWATIVRWTGRPDWMLDLPVQPFLLWGMACFGSLILMAPGAERGEVLNRNKLFVVFAACIGFLVAGITIGFFIARS